MSTFAEQLNALLGQWVAIGPHETIVAHAPTYAELLVLIPKDVGYENVVVYRNEFEHSAPDFAPFKGEWVAVINGKVVAHAHEFADLASVAESADFKRASIFHVGPSLFPHLFATDHPR